MQQSPGKSGLFHIFQCYVRLYDGNSLLVGSYGLPPRTFFSQSSPKEYTSSQSFNSREVGLLKTD